MQRREFLQVATAATAASVLSAQSSAAGVRIGVMDGTLGFASNPEAAGHAAALGFQTVQVALGLPVEGRLPLSNPTTQQQWKAAAKQNHIAISATYIDVLHVDCLKNSTESEAWTREGLRITKALGATILMLVFFGKCAVERNEEQQAIMAPLRRLAAAAVDQGVILALENTISAEATLRILDQVNSPALKVWYDIGNATNIGGFDIAHEIRLLGRERICEFHIKDKVWLGAGRVDIAAAAQAIKSIGYTGVCTLETSAPTHDRLADAGIQRQTFVAALRRAGVPVANAGKKSS